MMPLILVVGPWGSGTTVVMQILASLGALVPEPHYPTFDERTPNSWETTAFNRFVSSVVAEDTGIITRPEFIMPVLQTMRLELKALSETWQRPIALKYALAAAILPQLNDLFALKLIYVRRPMSDIEATRLRRGWYAHLGAEGAIRVQRYMADYAAKATHPIHWIDFPSLLARPREHISQLATFVSLPDQPSAQQLVRRTPTPL